MSEAARASQRVADHLLDTLAGAGLGHVFVVPGLQIDPLVKALAVHPRLQPVMACHELAAGYMADGYARASGGFGASFAIGGPGAANLVGAAITAKADRSPVLFVTGNIPAIAQGRGEFQDAGAEGSNDAAVFHAALGESSGCAHVDDYARCLAPAFSRLQRCEPAHLVLPMDVQTLPMPSRCTSAATPVTPEVAVDPDEIASLLESLRHCERVLLVLGAEALSQADIIRDAARALSLALATDAAARGLVDEGETCALGHLGFMPHPRAQAALEGEAAVRADLVLLVGGSRHLRTALQRRHARVHETSAKTLAAALRVAPGACGEVVRRRRGEWLRRLSGIRRAEALRGETTLSYTEVVDALAAALPDDAACVVDAGQARRIAVARWRCRRPRTLLVAEGMAPMGWSLGAAIGVQLAQPRRRVVALLGDGAMRMHGIEIATAARYRLPILYVLLDNRAYGTVLARMQGEAEADTARLPATDWCAFARSLGVPAAAVDSRLALEQALADVSLMEGPRLIVARVPAIEPAAYGETTGIDWGLASSPEALDT